MKHLPSFSLIRKKILFLAFIAICLIIGAFHNALGAELSCRQSLEICEKSCAHRDSMYKFQCLGDSYLTEGSKFKCLCGDEVNAELNHQRTLAELRRLQAANTETKDKK